MSHFLISYDLNAPGKDYSDVIPAIVKAFPTHLHVLKSQWVVRTSWNAKQVREMVQRLIDSNDEVLVTGVEAGSTDWYLKESKGEWLKSQGLY